MRDGNDNIDDLLKNLGDLPAFPVDWTAYECAVLARLAHAQAAERRRFRWKLALAALTGAAAVVLLQSAIAPKANMLPPSAPVAIAPSAPAPAAKEPIERVQTDAKTPSVAAGVNADIKPFARMFRLQNGAVAQIQFDGYSEPGRAGPSYVAGRCSKSMPR